MSNNIRQGSSYSTPDVLDVEQSTFTTHTDMVVWTPYATGMSSTRIQLTADEAVELATRLLENARITRQREAAAEAEALVG